MSDIVLSQELTNVLSESTYFLVNPRPILPESFSNRIDEVSQQSIRGAL
jgi:hypothetical protein